MNRQQRSGLKVALAFCVFGAAFAVGANDQYNAGADYARGVKDGDGKVISGFTPETVLPNYTATPAQSGYYGGVTTPSTNLDAPGNKALAESEAGKAITESILNNPKDPISPEAPFIRAGSDAKADAEKVADGSFDGCEAQEVGRTEFSSHVCERDINVTRTCTRDGYITGTTVPVREQKNLRIANFTYVRESKQLRADFVAPVTGTVLGASFDFVLASSTGGYTQSTTISLLGTSVLVPTYGNGNYPLGVSSFPLTAGQTLSATFYINQNQHQDVFLDGMLRNLNEGKTTFVINMLVLAEDQQWQGQVSWPGPCALSEEIGAQLVASQCTVPGGSRDIVVDGVTHSVYSDCWQYTDTYRLQEEEAGTCGEYAANPACTLATQQCAYEMDGVCLHQNVTYSCERKVTGTGMVCGGDFFCTDGSCAEAVSGKDNDFKSAVSQLAAVAAAGEDVAEINDVNVRAFTGQPQFCRKAAAGFNNCCKGSGWGSDVGLANCNSEEKALGEAKERLLTVDVGEFCSKKVLGVCLEKKRGHCVFDSKLAQIVQQQGRQWQLGIGFGGAESPDCSGISVEQLQALDFKRMDFKNFYADMENGASVPDNDALLEHVKQQLADRMPKAKGAQ
ncbi:type-F conjugative transfer system mating-pair stabilization protein TraN (plasmid) [Enterobacteriaceae bacterium Kacie_13]|nr:type-F conjugative transfer system mating-pair stabilization protein TraN [Enterobacteriaceae bacterium Kacie_13]